MNATHIEAKSAITSSRWTLIACLLVILSDAGLLMWGAAAALAPEHLVGPDSTPILAAGYEGFTKQSWQALANTAPETAGFMTALFRVYGAFNVAFALMAILIALTAFRRGERWAWWALLAGNTITYVAAMLYDRTVNAIGPFELMEYVGLGVVYLALAMNWSMATASTRP